MLITMITVTVAVGFALALSVLGDHLDQTPRSNDNCVEKPCGPFVCQAQCVAACLEANLGSGISQCKEEFCNFYDKAPPCDKNDTACWATCGRPGSQDGKPVPEMVDDLKRSDPTEFFSSSVDPYYIRIEWTSVDPVALYVVEALSFANASATENTFKRMTTENAISFRRDDLCDVYGVRVMAVNGYGISKPRYIVVDAWKPALHFDENFDVKSIRRDESFVKVLINFSPPEKWPKDFVRLGDSFVRAPDCFGPISERIFKSSEPENGYYTPLVFINQTDSKIELSFPAEIMEAQCQFMYRLTSLLTQCNTTSTLDANADAGVDFRINCDSVENSGCGESADSENTTAVDPPQTSSASYAVEDDPESQDPDRSTQATTVQGSDSDTTTTAVDDQNEDSTTVQATTAQFMRALIVADPDALAELQNDNGTASGDDRPLVIVVEPTDPNAPACKMQSFAAEVYSNAEDNNGNPVLIISWIEDKDLASPDPSSFVIRYGPVLRTLIVDANPDIVDETIVSQSPVDPNDPSQDLQRSLNVTNLIPNTLYAFQICAIFNSSSGQTFAWDTVPNYVIDLSAVTSLDDSTTTASSDDSSTDVATTTSSFETTTMDAQEQDDNAVDPNPNPTPTLVKVNLWEHSRTVVKVDVKPVAAEETGVWASTRALWFFMVISLFAITVAVCIFAFAKSQRRRQKEIQGMSKAIYYTPTFVDTKPQNLKASDEVKIPMSKNDESDK